MEQGHDIMFKSVFEDPVCARDHFERVLSAEARKLLDLTTLELVPGSFVDQAFKPRHTDLLFRATARGRSGRSKRSGRSRRSGPSTREAYVYLLFEHQSTEQPLMVFRLYCYMANIWRRHTETGEKGQSKLPLPPIVALVLYNGATRWRAARTFHQLVEPQRPGEWRTESSRANRAEIGVPGSAMEPTGSMERFWDVEVGAIRREDDGSRFLGRCQARWRRGSRSSRWC